MSKTLPVVFLQRTKPMHPKRLWAQDLPKIILSFSNSGYLSTRAFAVANATVAFTIPTLHLVTLKYFWTSMSICLSSKHGRPRSLLTTIFFGDLFCLLAFLIWDSYRFLNDRTVLSFRLE